MTDNNDQIAATKPLTGYKHPPAKTRFQKGRSGNPRGRPKESRNLVTVLSEALNQSVTLKQDGKSRQVTKGDALIDVLLNMASKGERRAVDAVINLIGKIERLVEQPQERKNVGVMVVPGVAKSIEEWKQAVANWTKRKELQDDKWRYDRPNVEAKVRFYRNHIMEHKGTPRGDKAAAEFNEITSSLEYIRNPYIKRQSYPSEQEGEEYRRKVRALDEARQALRDAETQGPEQQRTASKALEEAEKDFKEPYQSKPRPLLN
jgi:ElaB/YqjD/DUF883 family membrane-anchored ribosome-binding protein